MSAECGVAPLIQQHEGRIVGGSTSKFGAWPWQVSIIAHRQWINRFTALSAAVFHPRVWLAVDVLTMDRVMPSSQVTGGHWFSRCRWGGRLSSASRRLTGAEGRCSTSCGSSRPATASKSKVSISARFLSLFPPNPNPGTSVHFQFHFQFHFQSKIIHGIGLNQIQLNGM